nr:alanine racemase [Acetobacter sp. DmW_043]
MMPSLVASDVRWPASRAGAVLTVDLAALAANYRFLTHKAKKAVCAAVVKADAYGLGAEKVVPALLRSGAREFFVAHVDEGLALAPFLSEQARISVLHGARPGALEACIAAGMRPVLNSLEQIGQLKALTARLGQKQDAILQVDTGMSRFGLSQADVHKIAHDPSLLDGISLSLIMSHLACADTPEDPANKQQLDCFLSCARMLPPAPLSLAASSGIFLGEAFHGDLVRPGAALYGVAPNKQSPDVIRPVVRLQTHVLQLRQLSPGDRVGYGLTWQATESCRVAVLATGYADGFARQGAQAGCAWFKTWRLPVLGRISMDSMVVDISAVPEAEVKPDMLVDLLNARHGVDEVARAEGTIGYEVLTSLGRRYHRVYQHDSATEDANYETEAV